MSDLWVLKLTAFLHDPPDKAIKITNHEARRDENLLKPLGLSMNELVRTADHIASAMQRMNIPAEIKGITIDFTAKERSRLPYFRHTSSATKKELEVADNIGTVGYNQVLIDKRLDISEIKDTDVKNTYFKVWRFLPSLEKLYWDLPADTRIPDHTIWDHMDIVSALAPTIRNGAAFLSFKIGPVQEFIANAGKTLDLWAGSHLLSYLVFRGILAVIEEYGPDSIIFPYLREQPFVDHWLRDQGLNVEFNARSLEVANIPHRFLAIVPVDKAQNLSQYIRMHIEAAWDEIAQFGKEILIEKELQLDTYFKETWRRQITNAFHCTIQTLEWAHPADDENAIEEWLSKIRELPEDLWKKYNQWLDQYRELSGYKMNAGSLYGLYYEIIGMMTDQKSRLFEMEEEPEEWGGEKGGRCSVCGIRNPLRASTKNAKRFWNDLFEIFRKETPGVIKEGERLCAVCFVKRIYRNFAENAFGISKERIPSVATIASRKFRRKCLKDAKEEAHEFLLEHNKVVGVKINQAYPTFETIDGEWFYLESYTEDYIRRNYGILIPKNELKDVTQKLVVLHEIVGTPPPYFGIVNMDGDFMGKRLRGKFLPPLKHFLHDIIAKELEKYNNIRKYFDNKRLINPNVHMAISRALKNFSIHLVRSIVEKHEGTLIYAGGDDVLAIFPAGEALIAAKEIHYKFGEDFDQLNGKNIMLPGRGFTMSAGIVFSHYKYPLYDALSRARGALEEKAKEAYGRNAFVLEDIKYSGKIISAGGGWDIVDGLLRLINLIHTEKLSPRFFYRLIEDADTIKALEDDGIRASVKYLFSRHFKEGEHDKTELEIELDVFMRIYRALKEFKKVENPVLEIANVLRILHTVIKGEK